MPVELYADGSHRCLMFTDTAGTDGDAVQANQFLIVDDGTGAIIDPGGNLAYNALYLGMTRYSRRIGCRRSSPRMPTPTSSRRSTAG
jgi:flavorubredoxin